MKKVYIVEGRVTDPEAHGHRAPAGAVEWQFSDGPPGSRGSSADYLDLEDGLRAHAGCEFVFVPLPKFSHAYDFAFELTSNCEDASDVTPDMIRTALIKRATEIDDNEIMEACGCFDTCEIEDDTAAVIRGV